MQQNKTRYRTLSRLVDRNLVSRDLYRFYKNNTKTTVNYAKFKAMITEANRILMDAVIEDGTIIPLPYKLGELYVERKNTPIDKMYLEDGRVNQKYMQKYIDWPKTKKLWKDYPETREKRQLVLHTNEHSDGFKYTFKWVFYTSLNKNMLRNFRLNMMIKNKNQLSSKIRRGETLNYYTV